MKLFFYALALVGLLVPWYFNIAYLQAGGSLAPGPFAAAVGANALTTAITWDVYIAAVAFAVWCVRDAKQRGIRHGWAFAVLTFGIGLSFALPLYLARRATAANPARATADALASSKMPG